MSEEMATSQSSSGAASALLVFSWLWVGLPFAYGVVELAVKAVQLFGP